MSEIEFIWWQVIIIMASSFVTGFWCAWGLKELIKEKMNPNVRGQKCGKAK